MIFVTNQNGDKVPVLKDSIKEVNNWGGQVRIYLVEKRWIDVKESFWEIAKMLKAKWGGK